MEVGDRLGDRTIVDLLATGLARAEGSDGRWLVRCGSVQAVSEAAELARLLRFTPEIEPSGTQVAVPETGQPLSVLFVERDADRIRSVFRTLAQMIVRLHGAERTVGAVEVPAVRLDGAEVRVFPAAEQDPSCAAPDGKTVAGDWYVFGLLLWRVLMRGATFDQHGTGNAPDPRDRFADAPGDLCALAMDLVLLDPAERMAGDEVVEALAATGVTSAERHAWLTTALERGGVEIRAEGVAESLASLETRSVVALHGDSQRLLRLIRRADVLSPVDRARATTLITAPDVLEQGAIERAGALLATALSTSGVGVVWTTVSEETSWKALHAVVRADTAPLIVLEGEPPRRFIERCAAEGVPGVEGPDVDELPFAPREEPRVVEGLATLGVTAADAPWGRWIERWERWRTPSQITAGPSDGSVNREIHHLTGQLVWSHTARTRSAGAQLWRRCASAGDVDGVWSAAQTLAWFGVPEPQDKPRSDRARGWQRLSRATRYRQEGHPARVEGLLADELPLDVGAHEDAVAVLLLAEALFHRARWHRARRLLLQLRVDARLHGVREWDAAAVSLLVRMGDSAVDLESAGGDGWLGLLQLRAWIDVHLRAGEMAAALELARERRDRLGRWPHGHAAVALDARLLFDRLDRLARGGVTVPSGHPASPAWTQVVLAGEHRRRGDLQGVEEALREATHRFDGSNRTLAALGTARVRGLFLGGVRGGTLVEQADKALHAAGVSGIPRLLRCLLPELVLPLESPET